jgi:WXG100 family type VII secretion target
MSMTGGTKVTYEELESLSAQLTTQMGHLQEVINNAQKFVDAVAGVSWQSQAQGQFTQLHAGWQQSATQIMQSGTGMATFLKTAASSYRDTDTGLAKSLGQQ